MNILFFTSFPPPNTGQTIATKIIYEILSKRYTVEIINTVDKNRHQRLSGRMSFSFVFALVQKWVSLKVRLLLKSPSPDIVYTVYGSTPISLLRDFITLTLIKGLSNARVVAHVHSGNYGEVFFTSSLRRNLFKKLVSKTDKFIFLTKGLNKVDAYLPTSKVSYISNMISDDVYFGAPEVEEHTANRLEWKCFNVVFISNLIKEKGYEDLLKAIVIVISFFRKRRIDIKVDFLGAIPSKVEEDKIRNFISNHGLNDVVNIHGSVTNRHKIKVFLSNAHTLVLPTYYSIEAQPLSIIEALGAGTPVIATNHASIPEMVENGVNGFLVEKQSPTAIAKAIENFAASSSLWLSMSKNARRTYEDNFDKRVITPVLIGLFEEFKINNNK